MRFFRKKKENQDPVNEKTAKIIVSGKCFLAKMKGEVEASILSNPERLSLKCSFFGYNKDLFTEFLEKFYEKYLGDNSLTSSDKKIVNISQITGSFKPATFTLSFLDLSVIKDLFGEFESELGLKVIFPEEDLENLIRRDTK